MQGGMNTQQWHLCAPLAYTCELNGLGAQVQLADDDCKR
jgi:hypothetical protein